MLTWAIHGMVYLGSALMVYNVYSYIRFAKRLKEKKNWEKERATLNFPIVLLVMFLVGYLVVGIFGQPDLVMSGILFGGSIFVYVIFRLIQRIANRFEENEKLAAELLTAEESGRIKTRFLASVSHEMRTPMNAIIGLATLALQSPSLPPDTVDRLTKIRLSAQHMMGLITNVLMMNRVVSNSLTLEEAPFSLSGMLNEVNVIAKNQCEEKGLTYRSSVEGQMDDAFLHSFRKPGRIADQDHGPACPAPVPAASGGDLHLDFSDSDRDHGSIPAGLFFRTAKDERGTFHGYYSVRRG